MKIVLAAFNYHEKRTVYYTDIVATDEDRNGLHKALDKALDKGAKVISLRVLTDKKGGE